MGEEFSGWSSAIDSSNKGFKLLKKHGWKEGTGLGVCEQGRLEPITTYLKNNKRGLGAEKVKKKISKPFEVPGPQCKNDKKVNFVDFINCIRSCYFVIFSLISWIIGPPRERLIILLKNRYKRAAKVVSNEIEEIPPKKSKASKRMRKMQELEKHLQETEFERAFRRDFWPDNV